MPSPNQEKAGMLISEEIVEKMLDEGLRYSDPVKLRKPYKIAKFKVENPDDCREMRGLLRACLTAALPDLIEACAKAIEAEGRELIATKEAATFAEAIEERIIAIARAAENTSAPQGSK